ncbi:hypothetical protein AA313_de0203787 [Arthrobotrys entomopaga]|nr:hypothetical protein AA313_de0203787 [Arthrobotrys entomopaga]
MAITATLTPAEERKKSYDVGTHGSDNKQDPEKLPEYDDSGSDLVAIQIKEEENAAIKYRSCSWQKTAALLFSEYICLAILSFPYSYAILGLVPGLILTVAVAASVLYTSLVLWKFCLRNPQLRDVCDIGQKLFWGSEIAWWLTAIAFILNNTFIQGLHVLVGAKYLNTITDHSECTIVFAVITVIICFLLSMPRTFSSLSHLATGSAFFTFIAVLLCIIFAGIQEHPNQYVDGVEPTWNAFAAKGTSFVSAMGAFLNISYTFIGQIALPSFIAEMENPHDFPKALWAITIAEVIIFSLAGSIVYVYVGNEYYTAPAFGSLTTTYKKIAYSFAVPTIIFLGILYASLSARFVFFRIFHNSRHKYEHTLIGWGTWAGILAVTWILAFIIAEVIPFFSDLLGLMSSLFDSFFGFIFWGMAWINLRQQDYGPGWMKKLTFREKLEFALNILLIAIGIFFLTAGTYSVVENIITDFRTNSLTGVFTCASNGQ